MKRCFYTERRDQGQRLEFDIKYHILHDFRTSIPFKEKTLLLFEIS